MDEDDVVARLRDRWFAARAAGAVPSIQELCRDAPHLAERVRTAIEDRAFWSTGRWTTGADAGGSAATFDPGLVEGFEGLRFVGAGGRGAVFAADDPVLKRRVALKFLKRAAPNENDPAAVGFRHEAEITARLEHPGVVPVHAHGLGRDGRPFYAMRFVSERTLESEIARVHAEGQAPFERTPAFRALLGSFRRVCETVAFAHDRKILHCDLKPRNIMIGDYGEAFVVDWGSAVDLNDRERTAAVGRLSGTAGYMSPEHQAGRLDELGAESDVFSLGAVLYEILTGERAFDGDTREARERAVAEGRYRSPIEVRKGVPRPLDAICRKALETAPGGRYATAKALAEDLDRWSAGEPTLAWPEPATVRARRWVDRNRRAVGVAIVLSIAAISAVAVVQRSARVVTDHALDRADSRLRLALEAVAKFHEVVSDNPELRRTPDLLRKLLGEPLEFYRKLRDDLTSDPGAGGSNLKALAEANVGLALIEGSIGSNAAALRYYDEAIRIWTPLLDADPDDESARILLGRCVSNRGQLHAQRGELERAEEDYGRAGTILGREPSSPPLLLVRAELLRWEGNLLGSRGRPDEALAKWEVAIKTLGRIEGKPAESPHVLSASASLLDAVARLRGRRSDRLGALEAFDKALEIRRRLEEIVGFDANKRQGLADLHYNRGNLFLALVVDRSGVGRSPEPEYARAIEIYEDLARRNALTTSGLDGLASCYGNFAIVKKGKGLRKDAAKDLTRVREIYTKMLVENPENTGIRSRLAATHHNLAEFLDDEGRRADAEAALRAAIELQSQVVAKTPDVPARVEQLNAHYLELGWRLRQRSGDDEVEELVAKRLALPGGAPARHADAALELAWCAAVADGKGRNEAAARRREEAARSLRRAVELGLTDAPQLLDPEMKSVAERPEFRELRLRAMDRAMPKNPFHK